MEEQVLGPYRLIRLLGRGGMGEVYLADDPRLNRQVALKVLSATLAQEREFRDRFLQEARSVSALNHPNITTLHEIGEAEGRDYIAFEYVEGRPLDSILSEKGALGEEELFGLALPLAEALDYAHRKGIVHRDLKPANVLVSELGCPKISDFGLAKVVSMKAGGKDIEASEAPTAARLTQAGMVVGTIAYMSPEQALGRAVDHRSDIFSFGSLLYEMSTGRVAFSGTSPTEVLDRLLHGEPVPLGRLRPDLPEELSEIVRKALRKDPLERYQHLSDLAADLRHLIHECRAKSGTRPTMVGRRAADLLTGWRWAVPAVAAVVALVGIGTWTWKTSSMSSAGPGGSVAVMYFENLSDPVDSDHTGRMLASLLASELSGAAGLEVVSHQRLHDVAKRLGQEKGVVDRSVATEVARRAGVGTMILGQVTRLGNRIVATTELVDVASGQLVTSQKAEGRDVEDVFLMAESLGDQVRAGIDRAHQTLPATPSPGDPSPNWTSSVEALRAYVRGETHMEEADFEGALEDFRYAARLDPSFALAHFRLSIAARWLSQSALAHQAARRAVAIVDRAPAQYGDVIRANALYQEGAYSQAIPLLDAALAGDPNLKEGLYLLSQIYVHSARDGDARRAIDLMERLLELDPDFHLVYDRLALAYALEGDMKKARDKLEDWESVRPDKVEALRFILATLEGHPEESLSFSRAFSWLEGPLFLGSAAMLASRWDAARQIVQDDPDEWRADHLRAWSYRNRAVLDTYLGEFDRAVGEYRQAGQAAGSRVHEGTSGGVPASALQSLAELMELQGGASAGRREAELALALQPESARGLYYVGRFAIRAGDFEAAREYLDALSALPSAPTSPSIAMYQRALEAELDLDRGRADEAVEKLEALVGSGRLLADWPTTCSSAGAAIREGLFRTYSALGNERAAARTLEGLLASGFERLEHPVLYVRGLYWLGVHRMESGDREGGRRLLERFLEHWGGSTWEIPEVEDARARLRE